MFYVSLPFDLLFTKSNKLMRTETKRYFFPVETLIYIPFNVDFLFIFPNQPEFNFSTKWMENVEHINIKFYLKMNVLVIDPQTRWELRGAKKSFSSSCASWVWSLQHQKLTAKITLCICVYTILAKQPTLAASPSPSVGAAFGGGKMILMLPQGREDSEYVLSFEI